MLILFMLVFMLLLWGYSCLFSLPCGFVLPTIKPSQGRLDVVTPETLDFLEFQTIHRQGGCPPK